MSIRSLFPATVLVLLAISVRADVIVLKDGSRIEGDLKRSSDGWTVILPDGKTRTISLDAITSVQIGSSPTSRPAQQTTDAPLASLRRSVEAISDIDQIIERYQRFIDTTKDAKSQADAQADLQGWLQKKQQGLIKYGSKWVTAEEATAISIKAYVTAEEARELIRQNRTREAEQLLQTALAADPRNAGAHYLRGVTLFRQDKLVDARKAFEAVNSVVPSHPPTLNNLAVILERQNQQLAALSFYDQAMQSAGVNDYILNNAAEALAALTDEQRKNPTAAKTLRRFSELDLALQQQNAQKGLYRWGSNWVDQKKLDELKAAERDVRQKMTSLQTEFDQAQSRIRQIDVDVSINERTMEEIRSRSFFLDKDGHAVAFPLPGEYYDLQRDNQRLRGEQQALQTKLPTMQEQAKQLQQQIPVPQFTGVQQIVGVEGMPGPTPITGASAP